MKVPQFNWCKCCKPCDRGVFIIFFFPDIDNDLLGIYDQQSSHVFLFLFSSVSTGLSVYTDEYRLGHYAAAGGEICLSVVFFLCPPQCRVILGWWHFNKQEMCFCLSFLPNLYPGLYFPSHKPKWSGLTAIYIHKSSTDFQKEAYLVHFKPPHPKTNKLKK